MRTDEQAIRDLIKTWLAASEALDLDALLPLMAEDVVFMVPGKEPFGKAEFAVTMEKNKGIAMKTHSDIREIQVLGNWAFMRNYLEVTMTPPGAKGPIHRSGYVLSVLWKNPNGQWVIARDANLLSAASPGG